MSRQGEAGYRHTLLVEPVLDEASPRGSKTFVDLTLGLAAVIERLEYGAAKHPDEHAGEGWRTLPELGHVVRLYGHVEALKLCQMPDDRVAARKHLASIACRALFALTLMEQEKSE